MDTTISVGDRSTETDAVSEGAAVAPASIGRPGMVLRRWAPTVAVTAVVGLLAHPVIRGLAVDARTSDIPAHVSLLLASKQGKGALEYSIWYQLLDFFSFGNHAAPHLLSVAITLLAVLTGTKAGLAYEVVRRLGGHAWLAVPLAVAAVVVVPLNLTLGKHLYLGKFSEAIWHNSTTMLLMPISLVLVVLVERYLRAGPAPWWLHLAVPALFVLDVAAKPNFALALLPALAGYGVVQLVLAARTGRRDVLALLSRLVVVALPPMVVLGWQYLSVFRSERQGMSASIGVEPLAVWRAYQPDLEIGLAVLESFAFPLVVTVVLWSTVRRSRLLWICWAVVGVAVAQFAILAEYTANGGLLTHGNWGWAGMVAAYCLFTVCLGLWLGRAPQVARWRNVVIGVVLAGHVAWGIQYLFNLVALLEYR